MSTAERPVAEGLTQREAAALLGVSCSYLRTSGAPRVWLPGGGPRQRPLLRYLRSDLLRWASTACSTVQQDAP